MSAADYHLKTRKFIEENIVPTPQLISSFNGNFIFQVYYFFSK